MGMLQVHCATCASAQPLDDGDGVALCLTYGQVRSVTLDRECAFHAYSPAVLACMREMEPEGRAAMGGDQMSDEDLFVWPYGTNCFRYEYPGYLHMADDYRVVLRGSPEWDSLAVCGFES